MVSTGECPAAGRESRGSSAERVCEPDHLERRHRVAERRSPLSYGLYPKEAAAMVDTWRDSWFEPGSRLFYVAPRQAVDAILPLNVTPAPGSVVRVFVGRIELGDRSSMPARMRIGTQQPT